MACVLLYSHYNVSKTDVPCTWVLQPQQPPKSQAVLPQTVFNPVEDLGHAEEHAEVFKKDLDTIDHNCGLLWLMGDAPRSEDLNLVKSIQDIIYSEEYSGSENRQQFLEVQLRLSKETIREVADKTTGQIDNPTWLISRKHRLTTSNFGEILAACRRNKFPKSLFDRLTGNFEQYKL